MIFKDVCTKREYEKNGEKKAFWMKVGTLKTTDDGKQYLELFMFPNTPFYIFEQKKKEAAPAAEEVQLGEESPF